MSLRGLIVEREAVGRRTSYRWFVMLLIAVIWVIATADRANLGVALPYIRKQFSLSNTEAGVLISLFAYGYAVCQLPIGLLYKRLGPERARHILPLSMLFTSLFTGLMGAASSPFLLKLCRAGLGVAEGPFGVGSLDVLNHWFPPREKGTTAGLLQAATKIGPLLVPVVCITIAEAFGWRAIFLFFAAPGALFAALWWMLVPSSPSKSQFCNQAEVDYIGLTAPVVIGAIHNARQVDMGWLDRLILRKRVERLSTVRQVYTSWNIIGDAIAWGCMTGINAVMISWIPTYLVSVKGFASIQMGFLASAPFLGAVMGTTLGGFISDRLLGGRRKPCMLISAACSTVLIAAMINSSNNPLYLGALLYLVGLLIGLGYGGFSVYPMGLTTKQAYPVAFSLVNFIGQIGAATVPLVIGIVLDVSDWSTAFLVLAGIAILCFCLIASLDEPIEEAGTQPMA